MDRIVRLLYLFETAIRITHRAQRRNPLELHVERLLHRFDEPFYVHEAILDAVGR
jgi:hypothetical protein